MRSALERDDVGRLTLLLSDKRADNQIPLWSSSGLAARDHFSWALAMAARARRPEAESSKRRANEGPSASGGSSAARALPLVSPAATEGGASFLFRDASVAGPRAASSGPRAGPSVEPNLRTDGRRWRGPTTWWLVHAPS